MATRNFTVPVAIWQPEVRKNRLPYGYPDFYRHGRHMVTRRIDSVLTDFDPNNELQSYHVNQQIQGWMTWKRWAEGRPEIIIDPFLVENSSNEIVKLIQIGLLCVQENATKRPTMSSVMVWLGSENITIALPRAPAFTMIKSPSEDCTMSMSNVFTELSSR
ncbi:hypothetical protein F2Q69_00021786 [Brassica cretica]|uniref:Uncharacterized protein n=2 Tax=Brassica TaxID=3705 RepID=A0A8S9QAK0_BRACR|nr:hypothetical protein F2Q69_00021786 [Brassica cretica]